MFNKYEIKSAVILKNDYRTVYKEKYLKSKIQPYKVKIDTNLYGNGMTKYRFTLFCLSVILIYSSFEMNKIYYPQE